MKLSITLIALSFCVFTGCTQTAIMPLNQDDGFVCCPSQMIDIYRCGEKIDRPYKEISIIIVENGAYALFPKGEIELTQELIDNAISQGADAVILLNEPCFGGWGRFVLQMKGIAIKYS